MKYAVSYEGIEALRNLGTNLWNSLGKIAASNLKLLDTVGENRQGLGPHSSEIINISKEVNEITKQVKEPVEILIERLNDIADAYQMLIELDPYSGSSDDDTEHGPKVLVKKR